MKAVGYLIRTRLRSFAGSVLVLTGLVAVVGAAVIAFAAGAWRTQTLPDRIDAKYSVGFDYVVTQEELGPPRTDEVAALPGVDRAMAYSFMFAGLARNGSFADDASVFAGSEEAFGVRVLSGREMTQGGDDEFVVTPSFMAATGAHVGDQFDLYSYTQEQAAAGEFGIAEPAYTLTATLVGVVAGPLTVEDDSAYVVFPLALLDRSEIGVALSMINVDVADGVDDAALRRELATLPDSAQFSVDPAALMSPEMERATRTQARGTWLLALIGMVATVAILTQVITRQTRLPVEERQRLMALGFTDGQVAVESMARAGPPIVLGGLLASALAVPFSGVFPTGAVGSFEPDPGWLIQWPALLASWAVLTGALLVSAWAVLTSAPARPGPVVPSRTVDSMAARSPSLAAAVGLRLGFTRARGERGSTRAAFAGVLLTVAGLVAAITFGASLDRLIDEPFRYGWNTDVAVGDNGGESIREDFAAALEADPNVSSLVFYAQGFATVDDTDVAVMGMRSVRGDGLPHVLDGRLPTGGSEIAFGRSTARKAGIEVGDTVTLRSASGSYTFDVVGLAVLTGFGSNEGVGDGALTTLEGLGHISDAAVTNAAVDFASSPADSMAEYAERFELGQSGEPFVPAAIKSLTRVQAIPYALAGLLGLLVVLTVAHILLTSLRARRRDLSVMRALGAAPRFVSRSVHWQASLVTLVPVVLGIPVGMVIGRLVFGALADDLGAVRDAAYPVLAISAVVVGVVLLANLVAIVPARMASHWRPATALRTE